MGNNGRVRQADLRTNAPSWIQCIFTGLALAWLILFFAALFRFGLLVGIFERYRVLFGGLEAVGGLASVYMALQFPPFRQHPFSWPTFAYDVVCVAGFTAWTYGFEATLFPMLPDPGRVVIGLGTLLVLLSSRRVPGQLLTWINRRIRHDHIPQAPANPA